MLTLGKNFLILFIMGFGISLYAGTINAEVSETEIVRGESIVLTITVSGENSEKIPNIKAIEGVPVVGFSRRSGASFVHVNGQTKMEQSQTIMMDFSPENNITIPSFQCKIDGEIKYTKEITIIVRDAPIEKNNQKMDKETSFSLDMTVDKPTIYLGETVLLKVRFKQKTNLNLMEINYTPPPFKEFFTKKLEGERTYKRAGYTIHELNYLLTAKHEGNLSVEAAKINLAEARRQRQRGGWYVDVPKWTNISSSSLLLNVLKVEKSYDIVGTFNLTDTIDKNKVKVNKPINLKIKLIGEGNLDDYEGISFEIPNVTIYSDDAKIESKVSGGKLISSYVKSFVFIADHNFTIPSKSIALLNPKTGKVINLETKKYEIEITNGTSLTQVPIVHTQEVVNIPKDENEEKRELSSFIMPSYFLLFFMFLLGMLFMFLIKKFPLSLLQKIKNKKIGLNLDDALRILYPHISKSLAVEDMVRQLYQIKQGQKSITLDKKALKLMLDTYRSKGI